MRLGAPPKAAWLCTPACSRQEVGHRRRCAAAWVRQDRGGARDAGERELCGRDVPHEGRNHRGPGDEDRQRHGAEGERRGAGVAAAGVHVDEVVGEEGGRRSR
jgi:hypothetical protein